jgi:hypothetical protein
MEAVIFEVSGRVGHMRLTPTQCMIGTFLLGAAVTYIFLVGRAGREGFQDGSSLPLCPECGGGYPCPDHKGDRYPPMCPPMPDMSKYVLKTSIPPCPAMPDLANYMLKSECPPVPDLSQYVLKSSIPKPEPIIIDTSKDFKDRCGECPPCPRPRCPEVKCPPPTVCPAPPPCPRPRCPETMVKCKAQEVDPAPVRPYLTPLSVPGFG